MAFAGATLVFLAGCSSDVTRFSADPFSNPFNSASNAPDNTAVGTIKHTTAPSHVAQTSSGTIETHSLAPPTSVARYSAPSTPNPPLMARNVARSDADVRTTGSTAGWSAAGGTPLVVAQGETAGTLAVRYGVPIDDLLRANGFSSSAQLKPGTRIVIPVYNAASARPPRLAEAAPPAQAKERGLPTRSTAEPHVIPQQHVAERETLHFVKGPQSASQAPGRAVMAKNAKDLKTVHTAQIQP
ncbi:MAG TPA: LysM peptidoglycan-binding domain-containing protein, partial [Beijerinckiaceae bacterium]|nr:LysM peptidoglycan-binding domain-containing protein [Beijerinckiaceae bacterium]